MQGKHPVALRALAKGRAADQHLLHRGDLLHAGKEHEHGLAVGAAVHALLLLLVVHGVDLVGFRVAAADWGAVESVEPLPNGLRAAAAGQPCHGLHQELVVDLRS